MPPPSSTDALIVLVEKSQLLEPERLADYLARRQGAETFPADPLGLARALIGDGLLTKYQAEQLLMGRWRNFILAGKYKLLERIGRGGMAMVFLCEHQVMKRLVAVKILPTAHGQDRELLGRFHREARALSQLRHPNIVGAYDVDRADKVHFLVMEYIDGGDLDLIVERGGPMAWVRAANYIRQASHGLQHAHECGLVHRDVKPGNLLLDRAGTVKLLDLGLARIFHESTDDLTTGRDSKTLLGTVDYLAPEQALNSHDVDIRADIYGLGATFYFLLTGKGLFEDGTVAQKLSWHLHRPPHPIGDLRPDVPADLIAIIDKMLAKRPEDRHQTPEEVDQALEPWTRTPVSPPAADEIPQLSLAARGAGPQSGVQRMVSPSSRTLVSTPGRSSDFPTLPTQVPREVISAVAEPARSDPPAPSPPSTHEVHAPTAPSGPVPAPPSPRRRSPRMVAAMAAGVLAVVAGGWVAVFGPKGDAPVGSSPIRPAVGAAGPASSPSSAADLSAPGDPRPEAAISIYAGNAPPRPFATLRDAIRSARAGDRIVVAGASLNEAVELSDVDGVPRDLMIEGVNPKSKGGRVRWRAPRDLSQGRALLDVSGLEGFRLKGFAFDGQGRVADLIRLSGRGAGSTLEDIEVEGATRAGVVLLGWSGDPGRPATIERARFATADETEAAILFEPDPDRPAASGSIRIADCRFVGPFQAAILASASIVGLDVEGCRFYRATDGLRYRKSEPRSPIRIRVVRNTFVDLRRGIHFETTPPAGSSEIVASNNVFAATPRLATLDKVSTQPSRVAGRWIWTEEGKKSPTVAPGTRQFRKSFEVATVPARATLDIGGDETFVAYLNGAEVGRSLLPHFTQRVHTFEVAGKLRAGRNALAVQVTNRLDRLDSRFGTTAGLLAQLTTSQAGREAVLARTDETWSWSDQAPIGWTGPGFDDRAWTGCRPWPDDGTSWPWQFAVWDSAVLPMLIPPMEPIRVIASGNVRDYKSWEGYPTIDSERVVIGEDVLPRDPADDRKFLRLPSNHPLSRAGPDGSPVGVFVAD